MPANLPLNLPLPPAQPWADPLPVSVPAPVPAPLAERLARVDDARLARDLDAGGCAIIDRLLTPAMCDALSAAYDDSGPPGQPRYRSRIVMQRHGFGRGEYQYFAYPLPDLVAALRLAFYPRLVGIANAWNARLGSDARYPAAHAEFLEACHAAGQTRPTPLILRYGAGDYNCLHQDLYGEHVFPLQVAVLLSEPGRDFEGGEFVLTEQRPRQQSRVEVVDLRQGDAVVFAVNERPVAGTRGDYRVKLRHGVSRVRAGSRYTLGIIFHDAA
ncbi:2OG-Fe(II) oxygenase [Achromobacter aloeverae]|uniref:Proline hydroxylase n=1 Tax=Achromobacter aloeverae TaxID=1750518 RepID=A0A4Q1HR46_9BURK|nr:2OG-Fe(II) oxygenase [Achromobacter aloeverae]RXN93459.1 proline hydroxylase [Achromobacter aloeverae]